MNRVNVFKSNDFHMDRGDSLHILLKDETGDPFLIGLYRGANPDDETALEAFGGPPLLDYDGNVYTTVVIGEQEWIIENLRVSHYSDGTAIPHLTLDVDWAVEDGFSSWGDGYCWYNNDWATYNAYGCLYKWWCIENPYFIEFSRGGIVEYGWRVANQVDYTRLIDYLGGVLVAGGKLKEIGTVHWGAPNVGATNESGFTAMATGFRETDGSWSFHGQQSIFWTSTPDLYADDVHVGQSKICQIYRSSTVAEVPLGSFLGGYGYSVRCVRDI